MISVVVPIFNEEEILPELFKRLMAASEMWNDTFEVILIDDGSTDGSWVKMKQIHEADPGWKAIRLGRNFGHQAAISAGLYFATGDCTIVMDGDLQDPPEEVEGLLQKWREGYHVVYAVRARRDETLLKRACYKVFYRLLAALATVHIPLDAGDFCIMDRKVVEILKGLPERNRFIRGLRSWIGFRQIGIPYQRPGRAAGTVKYTYWKLLKLALDGITSFAIAPLRAATVFGLFVSVVSFLGGFFYLLTRIFPDFFGPLGFPIVPGFATIIIAVSFLGGVQLVFLGILGEYVARIYEEVKARPLWTTMELLGLDDRDKS